MTAVFMSEKASRQECIQLIERVYDVDTRTVLQKKLEFLEPVWSRSQLEQRKQELSQTELIFSTWGMFELTEEELNTYFPNLKAVFYGAGSVQYFARPFLHKGIRIFSAFEANAVPVAEYTTAQIILAAKGFFQSSRIYKEEGFQSAHAYSESQPGNYSIQVGLIGAGCIGRMVAQRLKQYHVEVLVFDPFLSEEKASELGVTLVSLQQLFSQCQVISNHLANNAQTKGMLNYQLFSLMKPNATFLNTGRGAQVVEDDLIRALKECPQRTAVLDVTDPEPVESGHLFYQLPNVVLTPHIAGSMGQELARMGEYMLKAYESWQADEPSSSEVTEMMLRTMA